MSVSFNQLKKAVKLFVEVEIFQNKNAKLSLAQRELIHKRQMTGEAPSKYALCMTITKRHTSVS